MKSRFAESWLALLIGLGFAVALFATAGAGAQEPERVAQAGDPEPRAAEPEPPAEPEPGTTSGIEEIVVRGAESQATSDFEASDSVTGFGAEDLAALGAQDIADLAAFTPSLEIVTSGATTPTFFIRGVGLNDFNANSTGAVAIYQDEVPRNAPALQLATLFDVDAVNVLRGPQGTGLARNASAGAIKIYSRKPTGNFGGFLRSEFGNFDFLDFEGAVEAPLYEDLVAGRFAFRFSERDGTMKNRCAGAPAFEDRVEIPLARVLRQLGLKATDPPWSICGEAVDRIGGAPFISDVPVGLEPWVNNINNWAARGTLLFQPTLDMSWLLNAHGARRDELSRLGQSIGTRGFYCADGDVERCGYIGQPDDSARVEGVLGGTQGKLGNYRPPEIQARLEELAPCNVGFPGFPNGNCGQAANRESDNAAKIKLAKELAQNLDSEPWAGDFNRTGPTTNDTYGGYLRGDIALPSGMQLVWVSGYDAYDRTIDIDLDFSPETLFQILTDDEGWQVTQDLRLGGVIGDEAQLRWDIGGWFLREQLDVVVNNDLGVLSALGVGVRDYTQDLWSTAGFASLAFDFWDDFTLDGGARYNWERKTIDYALTILAVSSQPFLQALDTDWGAPTGLVRLTYRFREDTHAYWKYTRGWKPGTYNATGSLATGVSVARPEKIDAFETGLSGSWLEGRLELDFSLFYYAYTDYQLFTAQQFANGSPEFVILNADEAEVYGAELDLVGRPWVGAFLNVRFGWLETQFIDFVQIQQDIIIEAGVPVVVNRELQNTGNPLLNSPRFKLSLTAEQTLPLGRWGSVSARYDGVWTDVTYFDATKGRGIPNIDDIEFLPENTTAQPAFWLHNLRLSYRTPDNRIEVAGWVRNLMNQSYKTFAFDGSTFNNTSIYFVGDPRTYGATLTVNF